MLCLLYLELLDDGWIDALLAIFGKIGGLPECPVLYVQLRVQNSLRFLRIN